jgi:hypothetical protein
LLGSDAVVRIAAVSSTADPSPSTAIELTWNAQRRWSAVANRLRRDLVRARTLLLALTLAGALLVTLGTTVTDFDDTTGKALGAVGALLLALVPVVGSRSAGRANVRNWVRARSISEGLKAAAYGYLTATGTYADPDSRDAALDHRRGELLQKVADLELYAAGIRADGGKPPEVADTDAYVRERVIGQAGWYRRRAAELSTRLKWLRRVEYALALLAAGLGATAAAFGSDTLGAWAPVATTAAAAFAAHIAAEHYEHVILGYLAAAGKLEELARDWERSRATLSPAEFVTECEAAISLENQNWMADWLQPASG